MQTDGNKLVIGSTEFVDIADRYEHIPAKVDTGADSSSIWASEIHIDKDGSLKFKLFDKQSPYFDGKIFVVPQGEYSATSLRSSVGDEYIRYRTFLNMKIRGKIIRVNFTLADRSKNSLPILIGRKTILNKFLVDVSDNPVQRKTHISNANKLTKELREDPQAFHDKYFKGENDQ